jgi:hypothetical protein
MYVNDKISVDRDNEIQGKSVFTTYFIKLEYWYNHLSIFFLSQKFCNTKSNLCIYLLLRFCYECKLIVIFCYLFSKLLTLKCIL